MDVVVEVTGEESCEVHLASDATYADLLAAVDRTPHEAAVLVDGRPVPADIPVEAAEVTVLQLVQGG